jgi:hypothetical protein
MLVKVIAFQNPIAVKKATLAESKFAGAGGPMGSIAAEQFARLTKESASGVMRASIVVGKMEIINS